MNKRLRQTSRMKELGSLLCLSGGGPGRAGSDAAEGSEGEDVALAAGGTDVQEAEAGTRQQGREVRRT